MKRGSGLPTLTLVELKLFGRDPFAIAFVLVLPFIMLLLLAAVFGNTPTTDTANGELVFRGARGPDYYMTTSIALVIAAVGLLILPVHLTNYREQGVLKRFRASSVSPATLLGSQVIVAGVVTALGSVVMVVAGRLIYDTHMPDSVVGVVVAFLLATLSFSALGFLLAALMQTSRATQGISLILFFLFWMLSGSGPPRAVLPDTARDLTEVIPLTHALIALQDPWFGYGWNLPQLLIMSGITVAATVIGLLLFKWQ